MNEFDKDVQYFSNDFVDCVKAFAISTGFFLSIFIIATVIKMVGA